MNILIETTEYREGAFRADGYLAEGGKRPKWLRQLVEMDATREGAAELLADRILTAGKGWFSFTHVAA